MRDYLKRHEDELLVVHKPRPATDRVGREPLGPPEALPPDVAGLADRLRATAEPEERVRLLAAIQSRFGNAFAAQVMEAFRQAPPSAPAPADDDATSGNEPR